MLEALISALFAASSLLAFVTMADGWQRHAGGFRAIRLALQGSASTREVRFVLITTEVRPVGARACEFKPFRIAPQKRALLAA